MRDDRAEPAYPWGPSDERSQRRARWARIVASVVGVLAVCALAAWLLWPSKGGDTADAVADAMHEVGCGDTPREVIEPADLPRAARLAAAGADEVIEIKCVASAPGPTVFELRFESDNAALDALAAVEGTGGPWCLAGSDLLHPMYGTRETKAACETLTGEWRKNV